MFYPYLVSKLTDSFALKAKGHLYYSGDNFSCKLWNNIGMRVRIFKDINKLEELRELLNMGYSFKSLSRHFDCDHSSIIYQSRKMGIEPGTPRKMLDPFAIPPGKHPPTSRKLITRDYSDRPIEDHILGDRINPGLPTYADYLGAEQRRKDIIERNLAPKKG